MSEKSAAAAAGKDVLYIDVDDEITGIIDKVRGSKQKIVALVLPKRATVFQSIVNMKLLKRSADGEHKNIVLITSEHGLLPLAGTVGIHVARSLQSKPEIPDAPGQAPHADEDEVEEADAEDEPEDKPTKSASKSGDKLDKTRTVGELAGAAAVEDQMEDSIDLNDEPDDEESELGAAAALAGAKPKKGTNKRLKVPNFNKFRVLLILGGVGVVALIALLFIAFSVMPKATISIKTDSSSVNGSGAIVLKTTAGVTLDPATGTVPATAQQVQKTSSQQVVATGQQNNGQKAGGTVSMSAGTCSGTVPDDVPAGTGASAGGLTFITQQDTSFAPTVSHGKCTFQATAATPVLAQKGGTQYNVAAGTYTISGRADVGASGSAMAGGTDNITKIVLQSDIDGAKQKLSSADTDSIKQELKTGLIAKGLYAIDASFNAADPQIKTSANAGDTADNVTVTQTTTYTMLGTKQTDLQAVIQNNVKDKIDLTKQKILDYGISDATFAPQSQNPDGATVSYQTSVVVGSELNVNTIKKQVAGKKGGDAQTIIKQYPGVTDVTVEYSPFWVSSIPKKTSKINVVVQKPTAARSTSNNATNP